MSVMGILFEKRIVDDPGFLRTPDRPVELLGTRERYPMSVKTTIGARGPNSLGGSATVHHCFIEPFGEGSSRTPSDLTPTARVLDAIMRTLLPRMGYRGGLTRIQLWLLNSLMQQTVFDIWDLLLEMEDTIVEG